jgi:hypothetical protein
MGDFGFFLWIRHTSVDIMCKSLGDCAAGGVGPCECRESGSDVSKARLWNLNLLGKQDGMWPERVG